MVRSVRGKTYQPVLKFGWLSVTETVFILDICRNYFNHITILCIVRGSYCFSLRVLVLVLHLYFSHKSEMYFIEAASILQCLQGRRRGNLHNINPYMAQLFLSFSVAPSLIDSFIWGKQKTCSVCSHSGRQENRERHLLKRSSHRGLK